MKETTNVPETKEETTRAGKRSRRPFTALEKLSITCLTITGVLCLPLIFVSVPGFLNGIALLLCAGFIWTRIRWAPMVGALLSGVLIYYLLFQNGYPIEHLVHPKNTQLQPAAAQFPIFISVVVLLAVLIVACLASLGAVVQNYRQQPARRPRWLTPALSGMLGLVLGAVLIAGIGQPTAASTSTTNGEATVHVAASNFSPDLVAVPRGARLHLVDDTSIVHVLANGSWNQSHPQPQQEPGAPLVNNVMLNGNNVDIGPFTTAGTYHIYCTIHVGMELTILVP